MIGWFSGWVGKMACWLVGFVCLCWVVGWLVGWCVALLAVWCLVRLSKAGFFFELREEEIAGVDEDYIRLRAVRQAALAVAESDADKLAVEADIKNWQLARQKEWLRGTCWALPLELLGECLDSCKKRLAGWTLLLLCVHWPNSQAGPSLLSSCCQASTVAAEARFLMDGWVVDGCLVDWLIECLAGGWMGRWLLDGELVG